MEFVGTWWALVPPLVAIVLALITKETYSSLFVGIVVGALLLAGFDPINTVNYIICGTFGDAESANLGFLTAISDPWNAGIFVFLVLLGIMVALVNKGGGSAAFGKWAAKHVKTRVGSMLATFCLGVLIFIDDYFNCLTVGAVMRPVTDEQKISRAKLSYIIDATAAPICMIAPVSSWAAAVSATAADLNTGVTGIQLFIQAIPYNFYSLLTIVFLIIICVLGFDYGPMAKAELEAYRDGRTGSLGNEEANIVEKASLLDLILPIVTLIVFCVIGMLYVGGFWDPEAEGFGDVALAFGNTDASVGLPWGSLIALIITFIYLMVRRVISFEDATGCFVTGFKAMVPAMLVLTFALTLKLATSALGADVFGILIPIVLPIFANQPELLTIGISACLAGAVCGDHISPISDTTVMASAGANVNHIEHVNTQIPYALTVAGISFVCFILAGFVQNWMICLAVGIILVVVVLLVLKATIGKDVTSSYWATK